MARGTTRFKLYIGLGVAAGVAARLSGIDLRWSVGIGVLLPLLLAAMPTFLIGAAPRCEHPRVARAPRRHAAGHVRHRVRGLRGAHRRGSGRPVIMTPLTGDWGVDLIVGRRPNRLAIQCKRQSRPVGTSAVQEVVAGAPMQDCTQTMVVTNNDFTPAARRLAELHGCVLVGGEELTRLGSTIRRAGHAGRQDE